MVPTPVSRFALPSLVLIVSLIGCGSGSESGAGSGAGAPSAGGSASGGEAGRDGQGAAGDATGGQGEAGERGAGGSIAGGSSGGDTTGGALAGGNGGEDGNVTGGESSGGASAGGTGGAGDLPEDRCRNAGDCPAPSLTAEFQCVAPGESAVMPDICGAPDWCGQCSCPPQPPRIEGGGMGCQSDSDCPAAMDPQRTASRCGDSGCDECIEDEHCGTEAPRCAMGPYGYSECFECVMDEDCTGERPFCVRVSGPGFPSMGGVCRPCLTTADCVSGVCVQNACTPACGTSTAGDCRSPYDACQDDRCVPAPCTTDEECGEFGACTDGACQREPCGADADCGADAACVNARCYPDLGTCTIVYTAVP